MLFASVWKENIISSISSCG